MTKESFCVDELTLPSVIIDIAARGNIAALAYVAISRVGKLSELIIETTTLDSLNADKKQKTFNIV